MKFYQELTLLPDVESSPYFLWSKVYTQIHIALADVKNTHGIDGIGVSFPQYRFEKQGNKTWATLGVKLRVFARNEDELNKLDLAKYLEKLSDYIHLKSIQAVPSEHEYAVFKRYHAKSLQKQAERFSSFKGIDFQAALEHCQQHKAPSLRYPFIRLRSLTNHADFHLSIMKIQSDTAVDGVFGAYGLSHSATVPDF